MIRINFVEEIKIHILCSITFFFLESRAFYEIIWKNIVDLGRPQMTIWRMRFACWIPKATNTFSEYVMLIAFSLQQWLHESSSMLRYAYVVCLFCSFTRFIIAEIIPISIDEY